jgi:hypothetical protein
MLRIIVIVAVLLVLAYVISTSNTSSTSSDNGKTVHNNEFFLCREKETLNRIIDLARANDKEAFSHFTNRQMASGECTNAPPIGTKVRVDDSSWGLICIARFGSDEPCRWTAVEAIK